MLDQISHLLERMKVRWGREYDRPWGTAGFVTRYNIEKGQIRFYVVWLGGHGEGWYAPSDLNPS